MSEKEKLTLILPQGFLSALITSLSVSLNKIGRTAANIFACNFRWRCRKPSKCVSQLPKGWEKKPAPNSCFPFYAASHHHDDYHIPCDALHGIEQVISIFPLYFILFRLKSQAFRYKHEKNQTVITAKRLLSNSNLLFAS